MRYKLHSSLDIDTCKDKLDDTLISDWVYRLTGLGYVGCLDRIFNSFWVYNRASIFMTNRGGYRFYSTRKFCGELERNKDETIITGEFKIINIYKFGWGLWFTVLSIFIIFVTFLSIRDMLITNKFDISYLTPILLMILFGVVGILIVRYNINRGEEAEEDTLEFIKGVLDVYKVESEEW
ncbi:hypothetical protein R9X47_01465 [Wukongibacter baidiensis]|uniref:hypothetical protein n=1 Tax=Wukongibacter baidiensis TaxID=1723361 RepID=UPI003D7F3F92